VVFAVSVAVNAVMAVVPSMVKAVAKSAAAVAVIAVVSSFVLWSDVTTDPLHSLSYISLPAPFGAIDLPPCICLRDVL
jgi:hypothetical protein